MLYSGKAPFIVILFCALVTSAVHAQHSRKIPAIPQMNLQTVPTVTDTQWCAQTRWGRYSVLRPAVLAPGKLYRLVFMLHGNGHGTEVMIQWAKGLRLQDVIFVCPEAPYVKLNETMAAKEPKYSAMADALGVPDSLMEETIRMSAQWYYDVLRHAQTTLPVFPNEKAILVGFSQGGFYSHVLATRYPDAFESVVSVCASMYAPGKVLERYPALCTYDIDFLVVHSTEDKTVPLQTAELIKNGLEQSKLKYTYWTTPGGHTITSEATNYIKQWISEHWK